MTTTACDDQFSAEPEPVHQPYDVAAILRKNIADLEKELQRQRERAEKAEAELKAAREQEPVAYVKYKGTGGNVGLSWVGVPTGAFYPRELEPLYASPIPAPAVPEEWRDVITELADDLSIELDMRYQSRSHYPSELRKYENEMQPVYRARALLQSVGEKK